MSTRTMEKVFKRLQTVHADLEDACEHYEEVCRVDKTHDTFKDILAHYKREKRKRPKRDTLFELEAIKKKLLRDIDDLTAQETPLYMQLETAGYDIRGFYTDNFIKM